MGARIHLREKHRLARPGLVLARSLGTVFEQPVHLLYLLHLLHLLHWKSLKHLSLKHLTLQALQALQKDCWEQVHPPSF